MSLDAELNEFIAKLSAMADDEWRAYAACVDTPIDLWFDSDRVDEAKAICETCAVRIECLDDAIRNDDDDCVRGGLADRVGVRLHRKRHRSAFEADLERAFAA